MTSKGRILFINRVFPPDSGASGLRLLELCQGLAEQGWEITLLTNRGRGGAPASLHPRITIRRMRLGRREGKPRFWEYPFWLAGFLMRVLNLPKPDIVITLTDPPLLAVVSALMKKIRKVRAVHWVHDLYPDLFPLMGVRLFLLQPLLEKISKTSLNAHDAVIALGDDMAEVLKKNGVRENKIAVIPNWPDVSATLIDKRKPSRHDSHNPYILEDCFTVLYSGNFGLVHDFNTLIEAMKIVQATPHPIRFILAGDGRKFTTVRDTVENMALTNAHFIREQPKDKFMDMLVAGDLHVASMVPESAGLMAPSKINSALGVGRPCILIGSTKTAQAKLISEYDVGAVIDPDDPHARFQLADAIVAYATDPARYAAAQSNALRAADSISFDKALPRFDALLSHINGTP